jgi:3alpha(or 20beta)-hydroxysteroid dehydrogenase
MNTSPLLGQVALVSGAARGIGLAIATRLAEDGANIVAMDLPGASFDACEAAVHAHGRRIAVLSADVTVADDWERAVKHARETFGRIDCLVNNAGIAGEVRSLLEYPDAVFDRVMTVNTRSVFLGMKHVARAMQAGGSIVNIASVSGLSGSRGILPYTASKHAVIGMTKVAALELAAMRIRVNAVCPAPTNTDMMSTLELTLAPTDPESVRQRFFAGIPMGRYGEPAEIAAVVAFLAGAQSSFMTGSAVVVDGGMLAS